MTRTVSLVARSLRLPLARHAATRLSDRNIARSLLDAALHEAAGASLARRGAAEARLRAQTADLAARRT
jgi:hypothetical protein